MVRRRHSRGSGACPLGEVTRQWHLRHPLGAKYRPLHFAPPIMMHDERKRKPGSWRWHIPYPGTLQRHTHQVTQKAVSYEQSHRKERPLRQGEQMLLGPQDSAGPRDYRVCSGHRDVACPRRAPAGVLARTLRLFSRSVVSDSFVSPGTVACHASLSVGFSRQEYWSGLLFLSPGDLPNPGIGPRSPTLQVNS